MSVWGNYNSGPKPPAGTPDVRIRWVSGQRLWQVYADGQLVYSTAEGYYPAHRWCQNQWRLTSTMMLPIYQDYDADVRLQEPEEEEGAEFSEELQPAPELQPTPQPALVGAETGPPAPLGSAQKPQNKYRKPGK